MKLSERLNECLKAEILCAEIYHELGRVFSEAKDLFEKLAVSEERHADILTISVGFENIDEMPNTMVPLSVEKIQETVRFAEEVKFRLGNDQLSLKDSLTMLLKMEESLAESYMHEAMTAETDSDVISYLQQFYKDETSHAEVLREFMSYKGYSHA